jgi:hypothetical protein
LSTGIVVRRVRPADYPTLAPAFDELSRRAVAANPHMAPAAVEAARLLVLDDAIVILAAWQSEALGSERLVGIWVLARRRGWQSGFASMLESPLLPLYEVSSVPVIDRDLAHDVATALLRHLGAARDLPKTLHLPLLPLDGPLHEALAEALRATGGRASVYERWLRPMLLPQAGDTAEGYLRRGLGQAYKKRMQQYRLATKAGALAFRRRRGHAAHAALPEFLALEAAGWKGEAGSAIATLPRASAYFGRLVEGFAARDGLVVEALLLDDRPIAMGLLIESAGTRHFLKIAYDEGQSRLSPGRSLAIAMIQADFAGSQPQILDSGAGDGVDAGTYPWAERRAMGNVLIGLGRTSPGAPHLAQRARQWLRRLRRRAKEKAGTNA